jgi:hypothetical protein
VERSRRRAATALLLIVALAFALASLAACGGEEAPAEDQPAQSAFAGDWEPVDASLDITWGGDEGRSYALSSGGEGGYLAVAQNGGAITVTLVGMNGERSDPLAASEQGKTLSFGLPISDEMPTEVTLTSTGDALAELQFEGSDITWEFRKTGATPTGD